MSKHLSISALTLFWNCPEAWRQRYVVRKGEPSSPTTAMLRGTAAHAAIQAYLEAVRDGKPVPSVEDVAIAAIDKEWDRVRLTPEELIVGSQQAKAGLLSDATRAASAYIKSEAADMRPVGIETAFDLTHPTWGDYSLIGRLDIVEDGLIRDIKTTKHPLGKADENVAHDSDQLTLYALAYWAETGKIPDVQLDYIVLTDRAHVVQRPSKRNMDDLRRVVERVANTVDTIYSIGKYEGSLEKDGVPLAPLYQPFSPAVRGRWGYCRSNGCNYHSTCPMGAGAPSRHTSLDGLKSNPTPEEIQDALNAEIVP